MPEFFLLLGIDIFLALSLLTCLLERHFPTTLSYIYQLAALIGFGNLLVSKEFLQIFDEYTRFWYSMIYLAVGLANIAAVNLHLAFTKKQYAISKAFLGAVTLPAYLVSSLFIYNYAQIATYSIMSFPQLPMSSIFVAVFSLDTAVVGTGIYVFRKPKLLHVTAVGTLMIAAASFYALFKPAWQNLVFLTFAMILGVACIIVLGVSVCTLPRLWKENTKPRQ
jgi:hypothetical protein